MIFIIQICEQHDVQVLILLVAVSTSSSSGKCGTDFLATTLSSRCPIKYGFGLWNNSQLQVLWHTRYKIHVNITLVYLSFMCLINSTQKAQNIIPSYVHNIPFFFFLAHPSVFHTTALCSERVRQYYYTVLQNVFKHYLNFKMNYDVDKEIVDMNKYTKKLNQYTVESLII